MGPKGGRGPDEKLDLGEICGEGLSAVAYGVKLRGGAWNLKPGAAFY